MLKVLVAYFSETGNTKKIAKAIDEEATAQGHDVYMKDVGDINVGLLGNYDLVFLGSACHSANRADPVKEILQEIPPSPVFKLAGFATYSTTPPGKDARSQELHKRWAGKCSVSFESASSEKQIELLGFFGCQGAPSPPIEEFIRRSVLPNEEE